MRVEGGNENLKIGFFPLIQDHEARMAALLDLSSEK